MAHGCWPEDVEAALSLSFDDARAATAALLAGDVSPAQAGAFLIAMRIKGETHSELAGIAQALRDAARRGVDVRLLLPGEKIDAAPVRLAAQRHYEELLRGGVRIFEYQPTMLHSKSIVVDGVWSVVGSANMNVRSRELDHEYVVAVSNRGFARKLEDLFTQDLARAREVRYEEWARRGLWQKLKERLCSAMAQVS